MRKEKLYLESDELRQRISDIAEKVTLLSSGKIRYVEMIALPYFGQVILRFDRLCPPTCLEQLDREETWLRVLAGEDFLVDFLGAVYLAAGVDFTGLDERLPALAERYASEKCKDSIHAPFLREDGRTLLREAGLAPTLPVWEIQINGDEIQLLTMDEETRPATPVSTCPGLSVGCVSQPACTGLYLAALHAHRKQISLGRALAE